LCLILNARAESVKQPRVRALRKFLSALHALGQLPQ
jgi:hypothetical protein